jgi:hypothetical protein
MQTWIKSGAGWRCEMPGNITLFAVPDRTVGLFGDRVARGSKWRAGVTHWCERTSTASRYGRDVYDQLCATAIEAKSLATATYLEHRDATQAA